MFLREMNYAENPFRYPLLLQHGFYKNYEYFILNLGTHPTAYVVLEKTDRFYGKPWDELDLIEVHGGFTYSQNNLIREYYVNADNLYFVKDKWVIGWDYAHSGDFYGRDYYDYSSKKWTTQEIDDECKYVIDQLVELNNRAKLI